MSLTVTERLGSRRTSLGRDGRASTIDFVYTVSGTLSELDARVAIELASPAVWSSGTPPLMWRQTIALEMVAPSTWEAAVHYDTSGPEPLNANDSFEFDSTGGQQHVTQSLVTVGAYPASSPNFRGAIGVTDSGVEGVDIVVPTLTFSETHYFAEIDPSYQVLLFDMTGTVNTAPFRAWDAGEVRFDGARARRENNRLETPWSITYLFSVQRNRANFYVGSILVEQKAGWDYMWVRYEVQADDDAQSLVRVPTAVYVEQVYEGADFSALGIDG